MKVMIELPDNWLDSDLTGNLDWITRTVREEVKRALVKAITDQIEVPKVEVTAEELKPLVLEKLAEQSWGAVLKSELLTTNQSNKDKSL